MPIGGLLADPGALRDALQGHLEIVAAILKGEQPAELTADRLAQWKNLPLDWTEERKVLGFTRAVPPAMA